MSLEQKIAGGYRKIAKKRALWKTKLKAKQAIAELRGRVKAARWKNKWNRRVAKMLVREARWKNKWKAKSIAMDAKAQKWQNKWVNKGKRFRIKALRWRVKWLKKTTHWNAKWWARSRKYPSIFESDYLRIPELEPVPEYV